MDADLRQYIEKGGCSAKIPPGELEKILKEFPVISDPDILVNIDTGDDAGVYRISDELALVLTTDFFPPVCSDPYEFGQIAAANSISDVYAMGGEPALALNLMMFPAGKLPMAVYTSILKGGFDKASEAGVKIIGGHTIDDVLPKYGLAVTGFIDPRSVITNAGARAGDLLILTKPLGTGIVMAGHRLGMTTDEKLNEAKEIMKSLNRDGAAVMKRHGVKGATDITGFGLAGHALKMARASGVSINLSLGNIPLLSDTMRLADEGCIPGACFSNLEYSVKDLRTSPDIDYNLKMISFDAQTSGGLLISVKESLAVKLLSDLRDEGVENCAVIGEVTDREEWLLYLDN